MNLECVGVVCVVWVDNIIVYVVIVYVWCEVVVWCF